MVFGYIYRIYHNSGSTCKGEAGSESMSINHQSEFTSKCSSSNHPKKRENNCSGNFYVIYVLVGILYVSTVSIICAYYTNQRNDLTVLRENFKNEFIVNDIKHIVQRVLNDIRNEHQPAFRMSERWVLIDNFSRRFN